MSKCSCGVWNTDNSKYCRNCGKPLSQNQPSNSSYQSPQRQNSPQKIEDSDSDGCWWFVIAWALIGLLVSWLL